MEHEKKKRQKKKKNKQGKTNESVPAGTSENTNHVNMTKQNNQNLNPETGDVENKGLQKSVVDSDRRPINGAEASCSVETQKSYWLDREASLEQKIKELQEQLQVHVQRKADLEREVSQSREEKNLWHHKEAELERRILHLQTEKDSCLQKEAGYEEKVNQLVEETATLSSMRVSFEDKLTQMEEEKVNSSQRENTAAEAIAALSTDNSRLRAQVIELESSRNDMFHQNERLKEHVSELQSKIQDLDSSLDTRLSSQKTMHVTEDEDMKSQFESARALVEKLLSENEMLVEKLNILNAQLDQSSLPSIRNSKADESSTPGIAVNVGPSDKVMEPLKDSNDTSCDLIGEIVQIPLDENDVTSVGEKVEVPLTDAPLIGAPFRFISFVARYVSGADLVPQ